MKKLIYVAFMLVFCTIAGKAQTPHAVSVFAEQGENFTLILDGMKENASPMSRVDVTGLPNDVYTVKIVFDNQTIPNLDDKIHLVGVNGPMDVVYVLKKNSKGIYVLRINSFKAASGATALAATSTPQSGGNTTTTQTTSMNTNMNPNGSGMNMTVTDPNTGQSQSVNMNVNGASTNYTTTTTVTQTTTTTTGDPNLGGNSQQYQAPAPSNTGCSMAMAWPDYESAKKSIEGQTFADEQLKVAKQIVRSNCVSAEQVKGIIKLFTFEDKKLDFAKFAYDFTIDKNNYYKINDAFTYPSSVDELNNYLNSKK